MALLHSKVPSYRCHYYPIIHFKFQYFSLQYFQIRITIGLLERYLFVRKTKRLYQFWTHIDSLVSIDCRRMACIFSTTFRKKLILIYMRRYWWPYFISVYSSTRVLKYTIIIACKLEREGIARLLTLLHIQAQSTGPSQFQLSTRLIHI